MSPDPHQMSPHTPQKMSPVAGGWSMGGQVTDMAALVLQLQGMVGKRNLGNLPGAFFNQDHAVLQQDRYNFNF